MEENVMNNEQYQQRYKNLIHLVTINYLRTTQQIE